MTYVLQHLPQVTAFKARSDEGHTQHNIKIKNNLTLKTSTRLKKYQQKVAQIYIIGQQTTLN